MDELDLQAADRGEIPASEVGPDSAPQLRSGVGSAFLEGEGVLLDPDSGASHVLDRPAALVTRFLDGESTLGEIAFDIADVLGAERTQVEGDVVALARTLGEQGLLEGVARDPHAGHLHLSGPDGVPPGADLAAWAGWSDLPAAPTLLVSWGTRCGFCTRIVPDLAELSPRLRDVGVHLVLVTTGTRRSLRSQVGDAGLTAVHVSAVPDFFQGLGTPVAYLVGADRTVTEPLAHGAYQVPDLARRLADGR
ncbi:PqqD family peptide modification chaperone [Nocardioides sp. GXQ0305]|uniref:PqqD family peptide modification chaperone n=1 Tax=Nocardioides sp. GXQ0305 TaxID=3423912 RepID=UPI003D7C918A